LYIPANAYTELRRFNAIEKRKQADKFWRSANPKILPQEIGFDGVLLPIGRDKKYQDAIDKQEALLTSLKDNTLDSSIILNSRFFGMIPITTDYRRIKKIKQKLGNDFILMTPSEFLTYVDSQVRLGAQSGKGQLRQGGLNTP
jgi:hypothetical protein